MHLSFAFSQTKILRTAIELELFTLMDEGQNTAADIARTAKANERGVRMLLNALSGLKVIEKNGDRYTLTEAARTFLSKKSPAYLGDWVLHMEEMNEPWDRLTEIVRTGKPARNVTSEKHGGEFFSKFVGSLYVMGKPGADAAAGAIVGNRRGLRVLDIGAGSGVWGIAFAQRDPEARVTVADFPQVIEVTKRFVARNGLTDRFDYLPGDFRQSDFGEAKFDVAALGHIVHSEGERQSKELFRKIRKALKPGGQLVIGEFLADDERREDVFALIFALNMLVNTEEGDTFSAREIQQWLRETGFDDTEVLQAPSPSPLLIGKVAAAKAGEKAA
jgi:ubiquinone/menaquinone biosynthesis C-methylase UbiE